MANKESAQFKARDEKYHLSEGYARREEEQEVKKESKPKKSNKEE